MPHSEATTEKENKYKYKTASATLILQPID